MELVNEPDFTSFIQTNPMCAVYYSAPDCNVCKVLKPKLFAMLSAEFPKIAIAEVDCEATPELSSQQSVFTIPTMIVYIEGKEHLRKARSFSPSLVADELRRPYSLLMED